MKVLAITNLYPRPDRPQAGLFNAQLFRAMSAVLGQELEIWVLVPEWRAWRWGAIRAWRSPLQHDASTRYQPVFYVPVLGRRWSARLYGWSARSVALRLRAAQVVFSSWLYPDGVMATRLAKVAGCPAWMMALGTDAHHLDARERARQIVAACGQAAGVVCVGAHLAQRLIQAGVSRERVHVVANGVDTAVFHHRSADDARRGLGISGLAQGTRLVLFVGNLVEVKAPEVLLAAFGQLVNRNAESLQLVLLGDGPLAAALRAQAASLGLADRVRFVGRETHERVAMWMNVADVLCLCSRSEGMPNVILEALASGLPVVATDVGACRDMLAGEPAASLVPSGDAAALARALRERLTAPVDRAKMAARHGQRTWRDQARDILELMRRAGTTSP
ncbi:MAG: glycosyltransferase [Verrucomicrobia bacterium]|nr:glycosyltransferase [Verrucomicrobiota bacterium]